MYKLKQLIKDLVRPKINITIDKNNPLLTNNGYLVSSSFCNPLNVRKELNQIV